MLSFTPDRQPRFYIYSSGLVNMRLVRSTKTPLVHTCITESKEHRFIPNMTEIFLAILLWMCIYIVWKLNVNTEVSDNPGAYSPLNQPRRHVNLCSSYSSMHGWSVTFVANQTTYIPLHHYVLIHRYSYTLNCTDATEAISCC